MDQPVFMKPGGELIMGTRNEENYLEGTAESAPWDEGPANGGFSGTFGDGNGDAGAGITAQSAGNSGSAGRSGAADGGKKPPEKNGVWFRSIEAEDGCGRKARRKPERKVCRWWTERRRFYKEDFRREGKRRLFRRLPERFRRKDPVPEIGESGCSVWARF